MLALVGKLEGDSKQLRLRREEQKKQEAELRKYFENQRRRLEEAERLAKKLSPASELRFRSKNTPLTEHDSIIKCRLAIIRADPRYQSDSRFARPLAQTEDGKGFIKEIDALVEVSTIEGGWMDFEPVWHHVFPFNLTNRHDLSKRTRFRNRVYVIQLSQMENRADPWRWVYVGVTGNWPERFRQHIDPENHRIRDKYARRSIVTAHHHSSDLSEGVRTDLSFRMTHIHDEHKLRLEKWLADELESVGFDVEGDRGQALRL